MLYLSLFPPERLAHTLALYTSYHLSRFIILHPDSSSVIVFYSSTFWQTPKNVNKLKNVYFQYRGHTSARLRLLCTFCLFSQPSFIPPYNLFHYLRELTCYITEENLIITSLLVCVRRLRGSFFVRGKCIVSCVSCCLHPSGHLTAAPHLTSIITENTPRRMWH